MANVNPWQARMKRWQKRWPVPIEELQAQAYSVLMMAYENVMTEDADERRRHIMVYFQGLTSFAKLMEGAEIAAMNARLAVLEAATQAEESVNGDHARRS
jgi:hypothetical protein